MFKKVLILNFLLGLGFAIAAIPPMKPEIRHSNADLIVDGRVVDVRKTLVDIGGREHQNWIFTAQVQVSSVQKGPMEPGLIEISWWKPGTRPRGWTGPQGQNMVPEVGDVGTFFLRAMNGTPAWSLMEPNGWDKTETVSDQL